MGLPASGMSRESGYISNIVAIQVNMNYGSHVRDAENSLADCCLDVDWLNDTTFTSCGADQVIHVMRIDADEPIKTYTYVLCRPYTRIVTSRRNEIQGAW
jgi:hypothetical protein